MIFSSHQRDEYLIKDNSFGSKDSLISGQLINPKLTIGCMHFTANLSSNEYDLHLTLIWRIWQLGNNCQLVWSQRPPDS